MKKWKKWTALLCAGAMLVSLTACGTQPAGSDSMAASPSWMVHPSPYR